MSNFAERGFLTEPRPEEICRINSPEGLTDRFTIGLKTITHTPSGLKIVPVVQVVFALDEEEIDLFPHMVRDLIPRLQEMCDAADELNRPPTWREKTIKEIRDHLELSEDYEIKCDPLTDDIVISRGLAFAITRNEVEDNLHLALASARYKELRERTNG